MHPMFVQLFIETDADELEEDDARRRARRVRRARARVLTTRQASGGASGSERRAHDGHSMLLSTTLG